MTHTEELELEIRYVEMMAARIAAQLDIEFNNTLYKKLQKLIKLHSHLEKQLYK